MSGSRDQNRIQLVDPDHTTGAIRRLFAEIRAKFALVPNLFRVLANAPAALEALMGLSAALARGALDEKTREQLALAIAESNLCAYCLSGHTAMAAKIGLSRVEIDDAIRASAADARTDAILRLARSIVVQRGVVSRTKFKELAAAFMAKINDLQFEVIETFQNEDGSRVASRWRIAGKNSGILGPQADQQPISFTGAAVWAVREDGKLCHNWVERSAFELFQQLHN
jgi:uncharacterized peroxidase-related enzyme